MASRVLPHNLEAERALLGVLLTNVGALDRTLTAIRGEEFFRDAHRRIYQAVVQLGENKQPIDLITVKEELLRKAELEECGGPAYLAALTDGIPRSANVTQYAAIVREKASLRELIAIGNMVLEDAYDAEASAKDIIQSADRAIVDLQREGGQGRLVDVRQSSRDLYADLEYHVAHQGELSGIGTGFASIDEETMGWQAGELIVIAARPSVGKTAFLLNTAVAAARQGKHVAIFSLEMRRKQLEYRLLAHLAGVSLRRIRGGHLGELDWERLSGAMAALEALPIWIDDRGGQTDADIRAACRRLRAGDGLDLVAIDYVQLMPAHNSRRGATRNEEVTDISRRLKGLTDELTIPILLLSQLSRASDARDDKRPRLTDLRESGALEQDADTVCFLHRGNHRESGTTNFILEKQRNGPTGSVNLTLERDTQTFKDGGEDPPKPAPAEKKKRAPKV